MKTLKSLKQQYHSEPYSTIECSFPEGRYIETEYLRESIIEDIKEQRNKNKTKWVCEKYLKIKFNITEKDLK